MIRTELKRTIPTAERKVRMKKCAAAGCRQPFQPRNSMQTCCSVPCAIDYTSAEKAAKERRERQEGLRKLKRRADWLKEAQVAFNSFIRARDAAEPCISCGRHHTGSYDTGHYRSVGAQPALRFHEDNCHKQCVPCNQHKSGNIVEYRIRLLQKIGPQRLALLEIEHEPARWTVEELQELKAHYKAKLKQLKGA